MAVARQRRDWRRYCCKGFNSASDLRILRQQVGLTRTALAQLVGCSASAVKYWEGQPGRIDGGVAQGMRKALEGLGCHVPQAGEPPLLPPRPQQPRHCGAKTRSGHACLCKPVKGKRRCKFHGGLSTGPRTQAGRIAIAQAQHERHRQEARYPHGVMHQG